MRPANALSFDTAKLKAKLASQISRLIRRHRLDYTDFRSRLQAGSQGNRTAPAAPIRTPAPAALARGELAPFL